MNKHVIVRIVLAFILVGAILGLGAWAYSLGVAQGMSSTAAAPAAVPYYGMMHWPFFGFPFFGFFVCLAPLFLLFIVSFTFRGLFWHRQRFWGHHYPGPGDQEWMSRKEGWRRGARSVFDEWHTEAHAPKPESQNPES